MTTMYFLTAVQQQSQILFFPLVLTGFVLIFLPFLEEVIPVSIPTLRRDPAIDRRRPRVMEMEERW